MRKKLPEALRVLPTKKGDMIGSNVRFFFTTPNYDPVTFRERVYSTTLVVPYYTVQLRTSLDNRSFATSSHDLDVARRRAKTQMQTHLKARALTCHRLGSVVPSQNRTE